MAPGQGSGHRGRAHRAASRYSACGGPAPAPTPSQKIPPRDLQRPCAPTCPCARPRRTREGETQCPLALCPSDREKGPGPGPSCPQPQGARGHRPSRVPSPGFRVGRGLPELLAVPSQPPHPHSTDLTHRKPGFLASPGNSFPAPSQPPGLPVWKRTLDPALVNTISSGRSHPPSFLFAGRRLQGQAPAPGGSGHPAGASSGVSTREINPPPPRAAGTSHWRPRTPPGPWGQGSQASVMHPKTRLACTPGWHRAPGGRPGVLALRGDPGVGQTSSHEHPNGGKNGGGNRGRYPRLPLP